MSFYSGTLEEEKFKQFIAWYDSLGIHISLPVWWVISFAITFLLAPFNSGIIYFFLGIWILEVLRFAWNHKMIFSGRNQALKYAAVRFTTVLASIAGFYAGKNIIREHPHKQYYDFFGKN